MDKRKGRPHPQPTTYKTEHPYRLLALYTIWDALTELDNAEERAWFNLNNPIFIFWCECAGLDAVEVRDRAYTLVLKADPTAALEMLTQDQHSDCSLTEEAIRSIPLSLEDKKAPTRAPYSKLIIVGVLKRDEGKCRYCGYYATCIDHVRPYFLGGAATANNLVASCRDCNLKKGSRAGFRLRFDSRGNGGGKGSLAYRGRVISPHGLFGCKLWNFVKQDEKINPIGRPRKQRIRLVFPHKTTPFIVGEDEHIRPIKTRRMPSRPNIPLSILSLVLFRDCWMCRYCGAPAVGVDHLYPSSLGGEAVEGNLVASCARCNNIKNDRPGFWLQFDPRLKTLAELGKRVWRKGTEPRSRRFYKTHPYGQKGTLRYRDKVVSPRGLFGDGLWDYIKEDTNKKGRRKFALRRKRAVSAR